MKGPLFAVLFVAVALANADPNPPHCTLLTKETDYPAYSIISYPPMYMPAGERYTYKQLHCINPPTVSSAIVKVCDWVAPPIVQFTYGDYYLLVERQDFNRTYSGQAVISITQRCGHKSDNPQITNDIEGDVLVTELN